MSFQGSSAKTSVTPIGAFCSFSNAWGNTYSGKISKVFDLRVSITKAQSFNRCSGQFVAVAVLKFPSGDWRGVRALTQESPDASSVYPRPLLFCSCGRPRNCCRFRWSRYRMWECFRRARPEGAIEIRGPNDASESAKSRVRCLMPARHVRFILMCS
jgi:hypothetical protein